MKDFVLNIIGFTHFVSYVVWLEEKNIHFWIETGLTLVLDDHYMAHRIIHILKTWRHPSIIITHLHLRSSEP